MDTLRKSVITKSISRTIHTREYENLIVSVNIQENIEWATMSDRIEKTKGVTKTLVDDFKKTLLDVMRELELSHKPAVVKNKNFEDGKKNKQNVDDKGTVIEAENPANDNSGIEKDGIENFDLNEFCQ